MENAKDAIKLRYLKSLVLVKRCNTALKDARKMMRDII
jgi:exonuclease VII small subunit